MMLREHHMVNVIKRCVLVYTLIFALACPQVAALAAYWKAMNPGIQPRDVSFLILRRYSRILDTRAAPPVANVPVIWNGIDKNCGQWPTVGGFRAADTNFTSYSGFSSHSNVTVPGIADDAPVCTLPSDYPTNGPTLTFTSAPTPSPT